VKLLASTQQEVDELRSKNAELEKKISDLMEKPYEAVFTLAASKSVDGTAQLVGMLLRSSNSLSHS
jgi:hypothetical protein